MSKERSERSSRGYVYDFLYHDARRIGSFLAQFDPHGHLQSLSRSDSVTEASADKGILGGNASFPLIGGVNLSGETLSSENTVESFSRTYDPLWSNALALFDYLEQRKILHHQIEEAAIGQFVLCKGSLVVMDTSLVQKLYQKASFQKLFVGKRLDPAAGAPLSKDVVTAELDALAEIPSQVQAHLACGSTTVWATLRPEGMVTPPSELNMKHGVSVSGHWHILGIKDANPLESNDNSDEEFGDLHQRYGAHAFTLEIIEVNKRVWLWLGRPLSCYGVTPLAIFRQIGE